MSTIYVNARLDDEQRSALEVQLTGHAILWGAATDVLGVGAVDPGLAHAEIVFGQPEPDSLLRATSVRWVQLSSAGWARYDEPTLKAALGSRGAALSTASSVYAVPVAEHVLAMMLSLTRRLPDALDEQRGARGWLFTSLRAQSRVLHGEEVLLLGYGGIARALVHRLRPFGVHIVGYRRRIRGDEEIPMVDASTLDAAWETADHLVNLLPEGDETHHFVDARRLARCKHGARLYNAGRGATVDQDAVLAALRTGTLDAAYLDVTTPEPLPPVHPLWSTPRAYLTPHTGGGHVGEARHLVQHFVDNLARWQRGEALVDRVV